MKKLVLVIVFLSLLPLFIKGADAAIEGTKLMKIKITIDKHEIIAILNNSQTSKDFYSKLPIELKMFPHQNREFYTNIKLAQSSVTQDGYAVGDIAYWTPGETLVFFYSKGYTSSLIILGQIISGLDELSNIDGSFIGLIERVNP